MVLEPCGGGVYVIYRFLKMCIVKRHTGTRMCTAIAYALELSY